MKTVDWQWQASDDLRTKASGQIPGAVNSNVRLSAPVIFFADAQRARLIDVDGNDYVDYVLGQGPNFLGHSPQSVNGAVADAVKHGNLFGGQHPEEITAANAVLSAIGWADMLRFGMTGTECVQAALRVARATTGRRRFVRFAGHYHGWLDNVLVAVQDGEAGLASAGQLASHLDDSIMLPWNDLEALEATLAAHDDIAAVIMEPVMVNSGSIEPVAGYLEGVRAACDRHRVVLIFDEVITGFRLARGGAVERFGVTPDLATYGKAMAGGWPVAALAGRRELMEQFSDGTVNHSGTFNGSAMATSSVISTMAELDAGVYERVENYGAALQSEIVEIGRRNGLALRVQGPPAAFHVSIGEPGRILDYAQLQTVDLGRYAELSRVLATRGVWVTTRGTWYISAAHNDDDFSDTVSRMSQAVEVFQQ
ncbi:UNVERIFIED_CONTAM: aminotransferase class III-fold pyridoxal phosphate-dependent enzyme [Microbacterium sp. SLM126]